MARAVQNREIANDQETQSTGWDLGSIRKIAVGAVTLVGAGVLAVAVTWGSLQMAREVVVSGLNKDQIAIAVLGDGDNSQD